MATGRKEGKEERTGQSSELEKSTGVRKKLHYKAKADSPHFIKSPQKK